MDGSDSFMTVSEGNQGSRKKKKSISKHEVAKKVRYSAPSGTNVFAPCNHNNKTLKCCKIRPNHAIEFRKKLYSLSDKLKQDELVSRLICQSKVKRNRPRQSCRGIGLQEIKSKPHRFTTTYKFYINTGEHVTVCKKFFLHLTKFKSDRVRQILKKLHTGRPFVECRGGDRVSKKYELKKESVRQFIGRLQCKESHYNRKKSKRLYLDCNLSIRKLWKMYNESTTNPELHVKVSMFRQVFCRDFNIGFRAPSSDVCSYCTMLDNTIKKATPAEKQELFTSKRIHKLRAKCFYDMLREPIKEDELKLCFDMQQVQPLPRTPIQQAYYSRQLGLYNVCIVDVKNQTNPSFFLWTEDQAARGSTEVASALLNYLNSQDLTGIKSIYLFSDGCTGQNKNNHVLHAAMYFLATSSVKQITLTFPVRGHSFLPADRIFGQVEKHLRKKPTIISTSEYYEEYEKVGKVNKLGLDWKLLDVKSLSNSLKHLPKISEKKRIIITKQKLKNGNVKIQVKGHECYRFEEQEAKYTLLKKGCKWCNIVKAPLDNVPLIHPISAAKKKDVANLLTLLFDEGWENEENLSWYKKIVYDIPEGEDPEGDECDCLEHDCAIHI